jgi:signal transduction histidine kinase
VDAGTVRTDILERMAAEGKINLTDYKVIKPVDTTGFPFNHSTRLYPEWPMAVTTTTPDILAQRVAVALLSLPADSRVAKAANSAGWTVPLDYSSVHKLMRELRVGHYKEFGKISTSELLHQYAAWIVILLVSLVSLAGIALFMKKMNTRLSQSKEKLETEVAKRLLAQQAENRQAERIRELYEASSVPGLTKEAQVTEMLRLGCRLLDMEIGKLCRVDEIGNRVYTTSIVAPSSIRDDFSGDAPLNNTFCGILYDRHEPLALNNIGESELKDHPAYLRTGLESYIGCPVWVSGEKYGTIHFSSRKKHERFDNSDTNLVKLMSRWVSVSLERQFAVEQLKESKLVAESANQAKSMFLANMSHELRTPLNAIIGYSEMLREDIVEFGIHQHTVDIDNINFAGKHLLQLINNILDLSKIESGKIEYNIETTEITKFVDEVASTVEPLANKNQNNLEINIADSIGKMRTDNLKLRQILLNVIGNACKFTEQGNITVDVSRKPDNGTDLIEFRIRDNGIGIPKDAMDKLFQEFVQIDNSITRKFDGTGLGLTISKRLCKLLGGDITAESEYQKGSTFFISIDAEGPRLTH